ncbi:MAG: TonB-dependent receptor [Gemmatimonadetes bacterium]|nr:TonB-dependent receptor [Gemmatimonadota bacterium]
MLRRLVRVGSALVLISAAASPVAAQQRDTLRTDTMVFRIGEIRVEARRPVTTVGGASAVEVTLDSLGLSAAPTVEEVLREIPTVHVRTNSRGEAEISVRGSESRQVAILLDGVPLTLGWDARTDVSVLPAGAIQELNLVRGVSSVLHGPNVLGGVVEVGVGRSTRVPARRLLDLTAVYDGVGGYGTSATTAIPFRTSGGQGLVRAGAGLRDSPGAPLAGGVTEPVPTGDALRLNTDFNSVDGFFSFRYARDGGSWLTVSSSTFQVERGIAGELGAEEPRLWRYPQVRRTIVATSAGTGDRSTPLGRGDLEASVGMDLGHSEIRSYATRAYDEVVGTEDGDDRTVTLRLLGDHTLGGRGDLRTAFTWADIDHRATVDGTLSSYRQRLASLGGETVWRLVEGDGAVRAVRVSMGGVWDRGDTPETGGLPSLGVIDDWGARVGVTALIRGGATLLHAGVSRRGRFPALRETYSEALNRFQPNPELRPEHLLALEGGLTTRLGTGELQVVGFRHRLSDAIRRVTLPDRKRMRVNSEELRSMGVEMLLSQTWGHFAVGGELTLQAVKLVDPATTLSREPENLPERSGNVYVRLPLAAGWTLAAEARYTGSQFCQDLNTGADVRLPAGTRLNGDLVRIWSLPATGRGLLTRLETRISVDNLTDTVLYDQCGLPRPGRLMRFQIRIF